MQKTILIPGGAGYIGSHTAFLMHKRGYKVIIIDNLLHGQEFDHDWAHFIKADFTDESVLRDIFTKYNIDVVMHFAALIEVGESVKRPKDFYENNVIKTIRLLNMMVEYGVNQMVFSSSCAVYGNPVKVPIDEQNPYNPISPYGKNKLAVEFALQDYAVAYGLRYVSLRYFNAAGATLEASLGEQHDPETHIIPLMLRAIKNNKPFKMFGTDYNTQDGTCVRDYIHVKDIADAHVLAFDYLQKGGKSDVFNLGSEKGYSVKQMVDVAQQVCQKPMQVDMCARRAGDVDMLIADSTKIKNILGWSPKHSDLLHILESAWRWEQRSL